MSSKFSQIVLCGFVLLSLNSLAGAAPMLYGPTPYLSAADSPFTGTGLSYFFLEDFEDGALNTPGVTVSGGIPTKPTYPAIYTDSVDADDGAIDGSGNGGNSWFSSAGSTGLLFTFNSAVLGSLPTQVGIVWTDGLGPVTFKVYDASLTEVASLIGSSTADGNYIGGTAEDRFFGVIDLSGIGAIRILSGAGAGIEVDHLQYGAIPAPGALLLCSIGAGVIGWMRRRSML